MKAKPCRFGVLGLALALSACATEQYYASAAGSWQGARESRLFRVWGYPDHIERLAHGHRLLIYVSEQRGRIPMTETPAVTAVTQSGNLTVMTAAPMRVIGGGTYVWRCKTWFEVNRGGVIQHVAYRGNHCVADADFAKQYADEFSIRR